MPKVSVVIPIYGVEKYIERCARSLFEQTLDDIEFVFVDDCTKDNSMGVLLATIEDYPHRKKQIKILHHKSNKGLSRARETGVNAATGDYIVHCDSDDWLDVNAYSELYEYCIKNNYDIVKAEHFISDGNNHHVVHVFGDDNPRRNNVISYLLSCKGWNSIWDIIVKRSVYLDGHIQFTDDTMLEDFFVVTQLLIKGERIGVLKKPFYYYYQNSNSICHVSDEAVIINKCNQAYRNIGFILKMIHSKYSNIYDKELDVLKYVPRRLMIPIMSRHANYKYWNNIYDGQFFDVAKSCFLPIVLKIQYYLVACHLYPLYSFFFKKRA